MADSTSPSRWVKVPSSPLQIRNTPPPSRNPDDLEAGHFAPAAAHQARVSPENVPGFASHDVANFNRFWQQTLKPQMHTEMANLFEAHTYGHGFEGLTLEQQTMVKNVKMQIAEAKETRATINQIQGDLDQLRTEKNAHDIWLKKTGGRILAVTTLIVGGVLLGVFAAPFLAAIGLTALGMGLMLGTGAAFFGAMAFVSSYCGDWLVMSHDLIWGAKNGIEIKKLEQDIKEKKAQLKAVKEKASTALTIISEGGDLMRFFNVADLFAVGFNPFLPLDAAGVRVI